MPRKLNLIKKLRDFFYGNLNRFTINNVMIFKKNNCINLIREARNIKYGLEILKNKLFFFDNRFVILSKFDGILINDNDDTNFLSNFTDNEIMLQSSKYITSTIPILKTLEGKLIKPYLYMIDSKKIDYNLKIKTDFDLIFIKGKN